MAYSYETYLGDGLNVLFVVPFPFISREHISIEVDSVPQVFTWINDSIVQLTPPPALGALVMIARRTPVDAPVVDFQQGSMITERDLDSGHLQHLYAEQELLDRMEVLEVGGGSGIVDHGQLLGLDGDDHAQYLTNSRGDARYEPVGEVIAHAGTDSHLSEDERDALSGAAAPSAINVLATMDDVQAAGGGVSDHGELAGLADDDHQQYLTNGRGDARYEPVGAVSAHAGTTGHLSADERAAMDAANSPSAANALATIDDIPASGGNVVGPESSGTNQLALFADGTGKVLKNNEAAWLDDNGTLVLGGHQALVQSYGNDVELESFGPLAILFSSNAQIDAGGNYTKILADQSMLAGVWKDGGNLKLLVRKSGSTTPGQISDWQTVWTHEYGVTSYLHTLNASNPHYVTAAQVGAAPIAHNHFQYRGDAAGWDWTVSGGTLTKGSWQYKLLGTTAPQILLFRVGLKASRLGDDACVKLTYPSHTGKAAAVLSSLSTSYFTYGDLLVPVQIIGGQARFDYFIGDDITEAMLYYIGWWQ